LSLSIDPHQLWQTTLAQLQLQMTRATFETWVKETHLISHTGDQWVIGVKSNYAKDWLENRLLTTLQRTIAGITGGPIELCFVVTPNGHAPATPADVVESLPPDVPSTTETLSPGQTIARADYHKGFFEKGGAGFSQLPHHTTYFWMPLLGPAFFLWKLLEAEDPRPLKAIGPNYWSPPRKYSYTELAARLNRQHGRYIAGDALECDHSRQARQEDCPLRGLDDCCHSPSYDLLRLQPHPQGQGLICQHWKDGLLDLLHREGLVALELKAGERKPTLQVWRLLPLLTPRQYARLNSQLQTDYDAWLEQYGPLFGLADRPTWAAITEDSLARLMPGYDQAQVSDNFAQRRKKQEFLQQAVPNPGFNSVATQNQE
jgi:hypothetical protein